MKKITVNSNDAGQRLDKFLIKYFKTMPQSMVYKALRKKRVRVNGKHEKEAFKLSCGDVLELYINDEFFEAQENKTFSAIKTPELSIVYEDENILLCDKPQGMVVHSDENESVNTLINHIQSYLYNKEEYLPENEQSFAPALANRIDRNTRGIVIAVKNAESLRIINDKIKNREIQKFYLCVVCGHPKKQSDRITSYLIKNEKENTVAVYDNPRKNAKTAILDYKTKKTYKNHTLCEVELHTGRTHQIRAQMAHIGCPLLGDGKYGITGRKAQVNKQALISYKLKFDFKTDAGILNYLNGKTFEIKNPDFGKEVNNILSGN
ncbi:MAG: RluA family pseudouridine synthase [Clostridia bacterium]|nr:RluA family pseudouridine synthase [Clostridia bacterium]